MTDRSVGPVPLEFWRDRTWPSRGLAVVLCQVNLFAIVFLQRLIIPIADTGVFWLLPICACSLAVLVCLRKAAFALLPLLACLVFLFAAALSQSLGGGEFSYTSFGLLAVLYLLVTVRVIVTMEEYRHLLRFFQQCMLLVGVIAIGQIVVQVLGMGMPILEDILPEQLIAKDFIYLQEVTWRSGILKPNGMVMLEPSFLSQFIGLALCIEFWFFRRRRMMFFFSAALALTFSGTGMLLAAFTVTLMVIARGPDRNSVELAVAVACVTLALVATGYSSAITDRIEEFSRSDASASLRFIAPIQRIYEAFTESDLDTLLLGAGAGFIDQGVGFAWNPPVKVLVEYGLVVWLAYWIFLGTMVVGTPVPILTMALALEYLVFGGGALLQPPIVFACFFLGVGYSVAEREAGG